MRIAKLYRGILAIFGRAAEAHSKAPPSGFCGKSPDVSPHALTVGGIAADRRRTALGMRKRNSIVTQKCIVKRILVAKREEVAAKVYIIKGGNRRKVGAKVV